MKADENMLRKHKLQWPHTLVMGWGSDFRRVKALSRPLTTRHNARKEGNEEKFHAREHLYGFPVDGPREIDGPDGRTYHGLMVAKPRDGVIPEST